MNHIGLGRWGEEKAAEYLKRKGYAIVRKNFRCFAGEIDIIAQKEGLLLFVEVKTRRSHAFGRPCEAVNSRKQERIHNAAAIFRDRYAKGYTDIRFDIMEVEAKESAFTIRQMKGAF